MQKTWHVVFFIFAVFFKSTVGGILPAQSSETRDVLNLDGLWHFTANESYADNIEEADDLDINLMPVPSSYNDISTSFSLREHVGSVWYQRTFHVPSSWSEKRVWIRFGSVCYNATVTINSKEVVTHQIGHLPFLAEVTSAVNFGEENTITVEVNNILTKYTLPQGKVTTLTSGRVKQTYSFDFFNYAGIDRSVDLYTTSTTAYVDDIDIQTNLNGTSGLVTYNIAIVNNEDSVNHQVNILDTDGNVVASSSTESTSEILTVENANLWWPYLMDPNPGYMYTLEVLLTKGDVLVDHYQQPFGIRELKYDNNSFTINGKNIYIRGFGRHEDSDFRGKGLDLPVVIRDYNLIKWVGANCYRTSNYPYAEEIMDIADKLGIMIIDEVPAANTANFNKALLENHKNSLTELYRRDKNRPSVIMWSIANDPSSEVEEADDYYRQVAAHIKSLDVSRPITIANTNSYHHDYSAQYVDIVAFNRYLAWDTIIGDIDGIYSTLLVEAHGWRKTHKKPVFMTEYGVEAITGLSMLPSFTWSEQYQVDAMEEHFRAFDELRSEGGWFIGEMIWNFADFKTDQAIKRAGYSRKGIFTRSRQPKAAAYLLRKRYWALAEKLNNATTPDDLDKYVIHPNQLNTVHEEL